MKKTGCALFGCAVVVGLVAMAGLAVIGLISPEPSATAPPPVASPPQETAQPKARRPAPRDPNSFHLTFHFRDAAEQPREVSCTIRRSDYERERAGFGYVEAERVEMLNRELRETLAREAAARGVDRYFAVEVYDEGSIRWRWSYPGGMDPGVVARIKEFDAWIEKNASTVIEAIDDRYLRAHGIRVDGDSYSVDYATLTHNATEPLADCFTALRSLGGERSDALLGLFLTFFQDLRYELPRDVDAQGRETLGFRAPTAVLVEGAGDCDSKSAAFCALWRQVPARVLLVLVPEHALVAVEGKPGPDQASIRLGNRYFILCEVAGPGRSRPGETDISGSFEYVLIEPA